MIREPDDRAYLAHNAAAWDRQVEHGNPWTIPVGPEEIAASRAGRWRIVLTPTWPSARVSNCAPCGVT